MPFPSLTIPMLEKSRYQILFESVKIGPKTARNRFYQVPHCSGLGHVRPQAEAAMRGMKAEGGWAVVSTQETEIHPTSDLSPYAEGRIWDERDIPALKLVTEAVQEHGSLAAIELVHNGFHAMNHFSRMPVMAPSDMSISAELPKQACEMDKSDIANLRKWHRTAALHAKKAGFDIIYVYAGHTMTIAHSFLLPHLNQRIDEYGGSLNNRVRLTRELLEDTREAVGDDCAVAFRFAVDEMLGDQGMQVDDEGMEIVDLLSDLPDLWDVNVSDWSNDSITTRFQPVDGYQNEYIKAVKTITGKPVVGVGRLTSPDLMVSMIKDGIVDFIGGARPSIADPFLPNKIQDGRIEDIRECIGCNICVSSDSLGIPIRCTQNPTMGQEWNRNWHPEVISPKSSNREVLIVGAGPAGLECGLSLAKRGYGVTIAETAANPGGRVIREGELPGLGAWKRVVDHRIYQLNQMQNVKLYLQSEMTADAVTEFGVSDVFVATGTSWRADGIGRSTRRCKPHIDSSAKILTPDDIMDGCEVEGENIVIYDDDLAYLGGVLAEYLAGKGHQVQFVTPANVVSPFTELTLEQGRVQSRLMELGVEIHCNRVLSKVRNDSIELKCTYTDKISEISTNANVLVTERLRTTKLFEELKKIDFVNHLELIGDAASPGLIADAVFSGHLAARNFERDKGAINADQFKRELVSLNPWN